MNMTPQEIISTVQKFPVKVQTEIIETLQKDLENNSPNKNLSEDEIEQILLGKGLISEIPQRLPDDDEETYKPIKIKGQPISETILEERN